jgi:hypothetical protein
MAKGGVCPDDEEKAKSMDQTSLKMTRMPQVPAPSAHGFTGNRLNASVPTPPRVHLGNVGSAPRLTGSIGEHVILLEQFMTKLQMARRAIIAVAAVVAAAPLRGARAQTRQNQGRPGGPREATSALIWARNETEFRQALQDGIAEGFLPMFDPRTDIELSSTIVLEQKKNEGMTWGANGNHAKIRWVGPGGQDMIVIQEVKGPNRGFYFEKFNLYGGGYNRAPCGACLKLRALLGDVGALYKFTLRDIYTSFGTYGIYLQGAVFEGMCENVHSENHTKDGMYMEHTNVGQGNQGIVSNVQLIHPNMSRNFGAGVRSVYSCNAAFGSFINNADGGIVAPEGLRVGFANNGENTGEAVYVVPSNGYGSYILYSEASTDGSTHARRWDGAKNDWVSVGKPTLYLLSRGAGVTETGNHVATYGGAMKSSAVRVVK